MKEYASTLGGRPIYSSDIKNLQELALSFAEPFKDFGSGFVLNGCKVTQQSSAYSLSGGYVFLDGRIRHVAASTVTSLQNLKIVAVQRKGDNITYNDDSEHIQYIEYYAEYQSASTVSAAYISYDTQSGAWPNLRTAFMNYYAVTKNVSGQTLQDLSISDFLNVGKTVTAGEQFDVSDNFIVRADDNGIYFESKKTTGPGLKIGNDHKIYYRMDDSSIYEALCEVVENNQNGERTLNLYNVGVDSLNVRQKSSGYIGVPIGSVQIFAGKESAIPSDFMPCDGRRLLKSKYAKLYSIIGDIYNVSVDVYGSKLDPPGSEYFRLPDLRGRFIAGYDNIGNTVGSEDYKMGERGGEAAHKLTISEMPKHRHVYTDDINAEKKFSGVEASFPTKYSSSLKAKSSAEDAGAGTAYYTTYEGGGNVHENRPPYLVLAYIIRVQ